MHALERQPLVYILILFMLAHSGCTPEATPYPVDAPENGNRNLSAGSTATIRYALATNADGFVSDLALIQASAQVEQLTEPLNPDDIGNQYDLAAAYGDILGGTRSPIVPQATLILHSSAPPLDNPALLEIVRRSLNTQAIAEAMAIDGITAHNREFDVPARLRTELANAGWPDGLSLRLAYTAVPGAVQVATVLQRAGINAHIVSMNEDDLRIAFDNETIQAALVAWVTREERDSWVDSFGQANVLDLYSIPISYIAAEGLFITFTPGGWPLPSS